MADKKKIVYPHSTRPKIYTSGDLSSGNERTAYPYYTTNSTRSSRYTSSELSKHRSADDFSFETTLRGSFVLKVYKASVTSVNVDAIVNAANDTMVHGGGVAKVISGAAGYELDKESKRYVEEHGPLAVSKNMVTTAGRLPYKAVIHAVGPMWHVYRDKVSCLDDLYDCVYNILDTCKKKRYRSVALTAISAGIFGVPKELCADMYVYAASNFSSTLLPSECPRELHIVDVDTKILRLVKESVQRWQRDPESLNQRSTLPQFLRDNPHLAGYSYSSDEGQKSNTSQGQNFSRGRNNAWFELVTSVEKIKDEIFSWGGVAKQFVIDNRIVVKIYQGDICKVKSMDAIVCGLSKHLEPQGSIADALKDAGGNIYTRCFRQMIDRNKKGNAKCSDVFKCDGGNLAAKYVLHVVINRVVEADAKEREAYQDCIANVMWNVKQNKWKRIVIPMVGTGTIQTNKRKLKLCGTALLKAVDEFAFIHGVNHDVQEIHLVNNKQEVSNALVEVFDEAAGMHAAAGRRKPKRYSDAALVGIDTPVTAGRRKPNRNADAVPVRSIDEATGRRKPGKNNDGSLAKSTDETTDIHVAARRRKAKGKTDAASVECIDNSSSHSPYRWPYSNDTSEHTKKDDVRSYGRSRQERRQEESENKGRMQEGNLLIIDD